MDLLRALPLLPLLISIQSAFGVPQLDSVDGTLTLHDVVLSPDNEAGQRYQASLRYEGDIQALRLLSVSPLGESPIATEHRLRRSIQVGDQLFVFSYSAPYSADRLDILDLATGLWRSAASPPPRQEGSPAYLDGKIYLVGGYQASANINIQVPLDTRVYDIAQGHWSTAPSLPDFIDQSQYSRPATLREVTTATLNGAIYSIGGESVTLHGGSWGYRVVYRYDPNSELWRQLPSLDDPQFGGKAVAHDGKILLFGGGDVQGEQERTVKIYDPVTSEWSSGGALPADLYPGTPQTAHVVDGQVYLLGPTPYRYDPSDDRFTPLSPPPYLLGSAMVSAVWEDSLRLFDWSDNHYRAIRYSIHEDRWVVEDNRPLDRHRPDAVFSPAEKRLFIPAVEVAGDDGRNRRYRVTADLVEGPSLLFLPEDVTDLGEPTPFRAPSSAISDGESIYLSVSSPPGAFIRFDPATNGWATLSPPACQRTDAQLVVFDDEPLLLGGMTDCAPSFTQTTMRYHRAVNAWTEGVSLPRPLSRFSAATLDDSLYVAGGYLLIKGGESPRFTTSSELWRLTPNTSRWTPYPSLPSLSGGGRPLLLAAAGFLFLVDGSGSIFRLDPAADTWQSVSAPPGALFGVSVDNDLYIFSRDGISEAPLQLHRYHPESDRWTEAPSPPADTPNEFVAVGHQGVLYLFGESLPGDTRPRVLRLDGGEWHELTLSTPPVQPAIHLQAHLEGDGWGEWVLVDSSNGQVVGDAGRARRLEAIRLVTTDLANCRLHYRSRPLGGDWDEWVSPGEASGSTGLSRALDEVEISLTDCPYTARFRAWSEGVGWGSWAETRPTQAVGTDGQRLEALEIQLIH